MIIKNDKNDILGGVCYLMMIKSKIATPSNNYLLEGMAVFKIFKTAITGG